MRVGDEVILQVEELTTRFHLKRGTIGGGRSRVIRDQTRRNVWLGGRVRLWEECDGPLDHAPDYHPAWGDRHGPDRLRRGGPFTQIRRGRCAAFVANASPWSSKSR